MTIPTTPSLTDRRRTSSRPVLDGFDVTIPMGTSLAIVGLNGAGKTTLAKLLCQLYDPQGGSITVDGSDVRDFSIDSWRSRVTAVFQDFVRYELSVRDNVAPLGAPDEVIIAAPRDAGADQLVDRLDTILARGKEGGTELFSTVRMADLIVMLDGARVVEVGSHEELIARNGQYAELYGIQANAYRCCRLRDAKRSSECGRPVGVRKARNTCTWHSDETVVAPARLEGTMALRRPSPLSLRKNGPARCGLSRTERVRPVIVGVIEWAPIVVGAKQGGIAVPAFAEVVPVTLAIEQSHDRS